MNLEELNRIGDGLFPQHLGIRISAVTEDGVEAQMPVQTALMAPNGFLHAGAVVTLADTAAGYGCMNHLPAGATGFTTVELKSNHLSTARDGTVLAVSRVVHLGRTTQVWDVTVTHAETGRVMALFRCTQMILYPKVGT